MTNYQAEQFMLEEQFVKRMLIDYDIREITTQRQAKNGTRQFKMPTGQEIASYKSGMVRRCDSSDRVWQLNPKYEREDRWVWLNDEGELYTQISKCWSRALMHSPLIRLNFILKYYLKNYAK